MKRLLLSATRAEISPLLQQLNIEKDSNFFELNDQYDCLISGIGLLQTCFELTMRLMKTKYKMVIQVGIAGSFYQEIKLCEVGEVVLDQLGDLGAEDHDGRFLSLNELGFTDIDPIRNDQHFQNLRSFRSISVNTVSGSERSILEKKNKFGADLETMEGFSLFYVCKSLKIPFSQIRAISNYVEPRNRKNWKFHEAIKCLNHFLIEMIDNEV